MELIASDRALCVTVIVALTISLLGCSDLLGVRSKKFADVKGMAVKAQYRLITQRTRQKPTDNPQLIVCTEPNPDVALAISNSLSLSAKTAAGVSADAQAQYAESVAQLGKRYATVSVLSNMLFRDCEDYANGAIDEVEYAYRMSRFGGLVVTLFALEVAGGGDAPMPSAATDAQGSNKGGKDSANTGSDTADKPDSSQKDPTASSDSDTAASEAQKKVGTAEQSVTDAKAAIKKLPKPSADAADSIIITNLTKNATDAATALQDLKAALMALTKIKAGETVDGKTAGAVSSAQSSVDKLDFKPTDTEAAASKNAAVNDAGKKLDSAQTNLKTAATAVSAFKSVLDKKAGKTGASPLRTNTFSYQGINEAQARAIEQIQWNYLRLESLKPDVIACATAISRMNVDGEGNLANNTSVTALQYICRDFLSVDGTLDAQRTPAKPGTKTGDTSSADVGPNPSNPSTRPAKPGGGLQQEFQATVDATKDQR